MRNRNRAPVGFGQPKLLCLPLLAITFTFAVRVLGEIPDCFSIGNVPYLKNESAFTAANRAVQ